MAGSFRDFLLSFTPASFRRSSPPGSMTATLRSATWGGLFQFLLAAFLLFIPFKDFLAMRAQQLAPQATGSSETVQTGIAVIFILEYFIHPLSLLLLYLGLEGLVRFFAGITAGEVVPNLFVTLLMKAGGAVSQSLVRRKNPLLADSLTLISDGRLRIAASHAKDGWNASLTIAINEKWFEIECEERGQSPRPFIYILRPAPQGKILRGYQEYDTATALRTDAAPLNSAKSLIEK